MESMTPLASAPAAKRTARPRRTQAERRADSERRVLEATLSMIGQKGMINMTFAAVGEAAGSSRGLPATIFGTKDNMIVQAAKSVMDSVRARTLFAAKPSDGLAEMFGMIASWFEMTFNGLPEGRNLLVLLAGSLPSEAAAQFPEFHQAVQAIDHQARARFRGFLENSRIRGELRDGVNIDIEPVLILGAIRGIFWQWLISPDDFDLIETGRSYTEQLRQRLLAPA